jgi:hypothetical protein
VGSPGAGRLNGRLRENSAVHTDRPEFARWRS